jgi:hypothetical protein
MKLRILSPTFHQVNLVTAHAPTAGQLNPPKTAVENANHPREEQAELADTTLLPVFDSNVPHR